MEEDRLASVELASGTWRGAQVLGVIQNRTAVADIPPDEVARWLQKNKMLPRRVVVGHTVIELSEGEVNTSLVITRRARQPETRWSSDAENCHSLVVSPGKTYVAFICELNGVLLLQVPK